MKPSKYLTDFLRMSKEAKSCYEVIGDNILVEKIDDEELKSKGGIIIATPKDHVRMSMNETKPTWVRVLEVGEGYWDAEKGTIPLNSRPGDICLVPSATPQWFSVFGEYKAEPNTIAIITESSIQLRFKGEEGYKKAFASLQNEST